MLKKSLLLSAVSITAMGLSSAVFANNFGNSNQDVYVGIQGGYGDTHWDNLDSTGLTFKDDGVAARAFAGYDFNQNFAIEGGYTYFPTTDVKFAGTKVGDIKTYALDLVGKLTVPVGDKFGVYAKAGPGYLHSNISHNVTIFSGSTSANSRGNVDLVYGVGANYNIMPNLVADVSFTRFNGDGKLNSKYQPNADLYAVGLAYKFNI